MKNVVYILLVVVLCWSCGSYVTPGGGVTISELADPEIDSILSKEPAATFPVNVAIARIQDPTYNVEPSYRNYKPTQKFSMVLTRDIWEEEALEDLGDYKGIKQASPFNRLLLPYNYSSIKDLRIAAAKMKADILLVYTFDTQFSIDNKNYGPQNVLSLGYLNNKEVKVVTTCSAALFDVQTEYLYGLAESTARTTKKSNAWKKKDAVDELRKQNEKEAFTSLLDDLETVWNEIYMEYATP